MISETFNSDLIPVKKNSEFMLSLFSKKKDDYTN